MAQEPGRLPFSIEVSNLQDPCLSKPRGDRAGDDEYRYVCFELTITNIGTIEAPFDWLMAEDSDGNVLDNFTVQPAQWLALRTWQPGESHRSTAYIHARKHVTITALVYGPPLEPPIARIPLPSE